MTTEITTHTADALERLPQQFKGKTKLEAFISAIVDPIQDIENAFWQLLVERSIAAGIGEQLNVIGRIVNQPRDGLVDEDYRRYLRARIATNKAEGLGEDLIRIARLIVYDTAAQIELVHLNPVYPFFNQDTATVIVRINNIAVTDTIADTLNNFLQSAKSAGVRLIVESSTVTPANTFTLDTGPGFNEYQSLNMASVTVHCNTVIRPTKAGVLIGPDERSIEMASDGSGVGSITDGFDVIFHFQPGVTTVGNFETAVATSAYIAVLTPGTGATVLQIADVTSTEPITTGGTTGGVMEDARD